MTESGPVTSVFEVTKVESAVQEAYPTDAAFTPAEASPWQDKHPIEAPPIVIVYAIYPSLHVKALATFKLLKVQVLSPNSSGAAFANKPEFALATVPELHAVQTYYNLFFFLKLKKKIFYIIFKTIISFTCNCCWWIYISFSS